MKEILQETIAAMYIVRGGVSTNQDNDEDEEEGRRLCSMEKKVRGIIPVAKIF